MSIILVLILLALLFGAGFVLKILTLGTGSLLVLVALIVIYFLYSRNKV